MSDPAARACRAHVVPSATRAAVGRAAALGLQGLKAEQPLRFADWMAEKFVMSSDSSHKTGRWEAWPFQVGWMDAFSNDDIEQVDVEKGKRVGYTKTLTGFIGYNAEHRRRKQALWQPTDDDRDSFVKSEVEPMITEVPAVRAARRATKGADDTIKYKQFRGTVAHFLGGKAARAYRRITIAVALLDELSAFDQQIEKSADPVTLARGRLEGAPFPKLICGSTPRLKGFCHLTRQADLADAQLRYRITCPHCGVEHPLIWGDKKIAHGFKWTDSDPATVRHVCPHCRGSIGQADYLRVWTHGAWVCNRTGLRYGADRQWRDERGEKAQPPRHVAFRGVWAAYSPQREWRDIVAEFLAAHASLKAGDTGPMQGFCNETLACAWEEQYEHTEAELLRRRAQAEGLPRGVVPAAACMVKTAIDVQGDRWELVSWAIGRGQESWAIDYRVIWGNTADRLEWDAKIAPLIGIAYPHALGGRLASDAMAIDTGFQTHVAYEFCRAHAARNVHAVKGDSEPGKPIKARRKLQDINLRGRTIRKGVALWHVGTDTAKDLLYGRLQLDGSGDGRVHFAADLPEAFFAGLTAESRVPKRTLRGLEYRWECPSGRRNEPLDCTVYCMFLCELAGLATWTDRQWQRAESALLPDLFGPSTAATAAAEPAIVDRSGVDNTPADPPRPPPPSAPRRAPPPRAAAVASDEWMSRL